MINSISLPDNNSTSQGGSVTSAVNFTEPDGFVDSVSGPYQQTLATAIEFPKDHTGSYELIAGSNGSPINVVNVLGTCNGTCRIFLGLTSCISAQV